MLVKIYLLVVLFASSSCAYQAPRYKTSRQGFGSGAATRGRVRNCAPPRLTNGLVTPLYKGKMMRFDCNRGYSRLGERYAECLNGRWSIYTFPICIKSGCPIIITPDNGKITYLNAKASAMLFCEPNYEIVGSSYAHCNGTHWDRTVGTCRETDNAPATFCDFESESICGWQHDTDHDFDFERRSGYNNKTISMVTGPHADHTTGIPFQGHYMVINTNSEVSTKSARLISPLYRIAAEKLCFQFYYHMYGNAIGTLRVYIKPESVEMQDVLLLDTEPDISNDYLVFEQKGSQGNYWREGAGAMKSVNNESFQMIIEAISGQTRLSDIAFDDVSLLSDDECSEEDGDSNVQETKDDDDGDGVMMVESCVNRCFEDKNSTVQLNANHSLSCSCAADCKERDACCPDYFDVCFNNLTTEPTTLTTTSTTKRTTIKLTTKAIQTATRSFRVTQTVPNLITRQVARNFTTITSTSTTPPITTSTTRTFPKMPQRASGFNKTDVSESKATEAERDYEEVINVEGEDEHSMERDDVQPTTTFVSDNIINERYMGTKSVRKEVDVSFIIKASVIAIFALTLAFFAFLFGYKRYKKSTDPLNYKEKQENGSSKANEEFSEIRFLTCEETLDFNLASSDSVTDL